MPPLILQQWKENKQIITVKTSFLDVKPVVTVRHFFSMRHVFNYIYNIYIHTYTLVHTCAATVCTSH